MDLTFELDEGKTRVVSKLQLKKHEDSHVSSLVLMGEGLELGSVKIDDNVGDGSGYKVIELLFIVFPAVSRQSDNAYHYYQTCIHRSVDQACLAMTVGPGFDHLSCSVFFRHVF